MFHLNKAKKLTSRDLVYRSFRVYKCLLTYKCWYDREFMFTEFLPAFVTNLCANGSS